MLRAAKTARDHFLSQVDAFSKRAQAKKGAVVLSAPKRLAQEKQAGAEFDVAWAQCKGDLETLAAANFWCRPGIDFSIDADGSDVDELDAADQEDEEAEEDAEDEEDEDEVQSGPATSVKPKPKRLVWTERLSLEYVQAAAPSYNVKEKKQASTEADWERVVYRILNRIQNEYIF